MEKEHSSLSRIGMEKVYKEMDLSLGPSKFDRFEGKFLEKNSQMTTIFL
jgi:hypothetical protein